MMQPLFKGDLLMLDDFRIREFTKNEARMLNPLQLALVGMEYLRFLLEITY